MLGVAVSGASTQVSAEVTAAVNALRVEHGLSPLIAYATDDEVRRVHDHLVATEAMHTLFAESAAYYLERGASNFAETQAHVEGLGCSATVLVEQWVDSDFHLGLLLTPDATHLSVAASCDAAHAWATAHVITEVSAGQAEPAEGEGQDTSGATTGSEERGGAVGTSAESSGDPSTSDAPTSSPPPSEEASTDEASAGTLAPSPETALTATESWPERVEPVAPASAGQVDSGIQGEGRDADPDHRQSAARESITQELDQSDVRAAPVGAVRSASVTADSSRPSGSGLALGVGAVLAGFLVVALVPGPRRRR